MLAKELREKSIEALREELEALNREQFNLRMQKSSGVARADLFKKGRKKIAQINTILHEKLGSK